MFSDPVNGVHCHPLKPSQILEWSTVNERKAACNKFIFRNGYTNLHGNKTMFDMTYDDDAVSRKLILVWA